MIVKLIARARLWVSCAALMGCGPTIGDACTTNPDCGPGVCLNRDFAPGGYCSRACGTGIAACPLGSTCVDSSISRGVAGCMRVCRNTLDCRAGYVCQRERDSLETVCVGPEGV